MKTMPASQHTTSGWDSLGSFANCTPASLASAQRNGRKEKQQRLCEFESGRCKSKGPAAQGRSGVIQGGIAGKGVGQVAAGVIYGGGTGVFRPARANARNLKDTCSI
jgi:hypothetical protein